MTAPDLKPCPFCGGEARKWQDPSHSAAWFIGCDDGDRDCFGSIHWAETEAEALAAWNRRAALPARGVGVKPLVWEPSVIGKPWHSAKAPWGWYYAQWDDETQAWFASLEMGEVEAPIILSPSDVPTIDAAKAAAQADYEARILAAIQPAPEARQEALADLGPIADLLPDAVAAAEKAMLKYPQPNYVISKWAEETGEVTKDLIHMAEGRQSADKLRGEMVQALAMLHRLLVEGDQVHGLPPVAAAIRALLPPADLAAKIGGE